MRSASIIATCASFLFLALVNASDHYAHKVKRGNGDGHGHRPGVDSWAYGAPEYTASLEYGNGGDTTPTTDCEESEIPVCTEFKQLRPMYLD
jgi:hypothetical protein